MSKRDTNEFSHLVSQTMSSEVSQVSGKISNVIFIPCMIEENILKSSYPRFELEGVGFDFSGALKKSSGQILPELIGESIVEKLGIPECYLGIIFANGCYYLAISKSRSDLAEALSSASAENLAA